MNKYKNNNEIIEAIQWNVSTIDIVIDWLGENLISEAREGIGCVGYWIKKPIRDIMLSYGDYIIKGVNGEFYTCKPDIFIENYELINK